MPAITPDQMINEKRNVDQWESKFQQVAGRSPTDAERARITNAEKKYWIERASTIATRSNNYDAAVRKEASAIGLELTPEDIASMRETYFDLGTSGKTLDDTSRSYMERLYTEKTNQEAKDALDKQLFPEKYLDETQKNQNIQTASGLIASIYGSDYQDTEGMTQFLADKLAKGESAYEIAQFLKTTPDYQKRQSDLENERVKTEAAAARAALNDELVKSQNEVFNKALPSIVGSYMRAGRLNSSAVDAAMANAAKDLESKRQSFVANAAYNDAIRAQGYNREDFVNSQNAAWNQYVRQNDPSYKNQYALNDVSNQLTYQQPYADLSRYYANNDAARQRNWEIEDYNAQSSDFYRSLSEYRKAQREAALYGLAGNATGALLKGFFA